MTARRSCRPLIWIKADDDLLCYWMSVRRQEEVTEMFDSPKVIRPR
jgi:hypothetical protein